MTSVAQLEHYLEEHLTKELAWLLRAATEWHAQHCMNLGIDGYSMQVYALDSTVLHARTLFESEYKRRTKRELLQLHCVQGTAYRIDLVSISLEKADS